MHSTSNRSGFTLIELLIVVAIIGILAAVLIPNLLGARARAFDAGALQCARTVALTAESSRTALDSLDWQFTQTDVEVYDPNSCGVNYEWDEGPATEYTLINGDTGTLTPGFPATGSEDFSILVQHERGRTAYLITGTPDGVNVAAAARFTLE